MSFKLFNSKKEKIGFAIFFVSIVLIPVLIFAAKQVNDIRQRAFESQSIPVTDQAILAFSYNEPFYGRPIAVGQTFGVTLEIDSPLDITAIESFINFDPNILEVVEISDITKDDFVLNASSSAYSRPPLFQHAQIVKSEFSNQLGTINYAILASPNEDYTQYRSNIAYYGEVIFKAKQSGNASLFYNTNQPTSAVAAKGFGSQNVLTKNFSLSLEFTDKPPTILVPTTIKFGSLNTNIPPDLRVDVTITETDSNSSSLQTLPLQQTGLAQGLAMILIPVDKAYQMTLHRAGFLDVTRSGYITSGTTNYSIDATDTPLIPGDIHSNGIIDIFDYNIFVENFGKGTPILCRIGCYADPSQIIPSDLDFSGKTDIFDYNIFVENFGKGK